MIVAVRATPMAAVFKGDINSEVEAELVCNRYHLFSCQYLGAENRSYCILRGNDIYEGNPGGYWGLPFLVLVFNSVSWRRFSLPSVSADIL